MVIQRKTQRPVQFELTEPTTAAVAGWLEKAQIRGDQYLFPSRLTSSSHVSTRQYARIVHHWVDAAGLDSSAYGTHSMRRTKATLIYKRTKNLRAVQLLLRHTKHGPVSRNRGRRRVGNLRANGNLAALPGGRTARNVRPLSGIMSNACSRPSAAGRLLSRLGI